MTGKSVVIIGSTSGVGCEIAKEAARGGYDLVLAARDVEQNELVATDIRTRYDKVSVKTLNFEALDFESHPGFFKKCKNELGSLPDGIVVCFGYMVDQELTEENFEEAKKTIDVNYTGAVSILNIVAEDFEKRGGGAIVGISSVAGDRGRQSNYIYGSAKAGFTAYLAGLRNRLA